MVGEGEADVGKVGERDETSGDEAEVFLPGVGVGKARVASVAVGFGFGFGPGFEEAGGAGASLVGADPPSERRA